MLSASLASVVAQLLQFAVDQSQCAAQLQDDSGVDGVLAGGSPVHEIGGVFVVRGDQVFQLLHQRNGKISRQSRGFAQFSVIE